MKPLIGIVEWPYLDKDDDKIYEIVTPIVEWVVRSGGKPIGLFPTQIDEFIDKRIFDLNEMNEIELKELKESIMMCDGIIKPGALKIYPHESKIYEYAYAENIPYLGICAGMQIMRNHNVEYKSNVKNDSSIIHHSKEDYIHLVKLAPYTKLSSIIGKEEIMVNSRHKYHVIDAGSKNIAAYSEDGYIESLEASDKLFNIGVQWHPELLPVEDKNSQKLFNNFVESAKTYKKTIKR